MRFAVYELPRRATHVECGACSVPVPRGEACWHGSIPTCDACYLAWLERCEAWRGDVA